MTATLTQWLAACDEARDFHECVAYAGVCSMTSETFEDLSPLAKVLVKSLPNHLGFFPGKVKREEVKSEKGGVP